MKIAVCFKVLADYQRLFSSTPELNELYQIDTSYIRQLFNCFDESALEMALQLRDCLIAKEQTAALSAMTVDRQRADIFLKHLAAVGYDELVRIQCDHRIDLRFNPLTVSRLLSALLNQNLPDLVLFGTQGADGDNRQTGFLVAEHLQWPCISQVEKIENTNASGRLKVFSRTDQGTLIQTVTLPVVLIIGQSREAPYLRLPNLKQKMDARTRHITLLSPHDLDIDLKPLLSGHKSLLGLEFCQPAHVCTFLQDQLQENQVLEGQAPEEQAPREQARQLFDLYLKKRLFP